MMSTKLVTRRAGFALLSLLALGVGCRGGEASGREGRSGPVPVTVGTVETRDVPVELEALGAVESVGTVEIVSQVTGLVLDAHFREGDLVKRGQLLFSIDTRPYSATLAAAKAQLDKDQVLALQAQEEADRQQKLFDQGLTTAQDLSRARSTASAASAALQAAQAQIGSASLNVQFAQIRSPIEGRTGSLRIYPGNVVKANDPNPLVVIRSLVPIYVRFAVPEEHLAEIRARMAEGNLEVRATPRGAGATTAVGQLTFVENAVDRATGTISLKAQFTNSDYALWPGQFVSVAVRLRTEAQATILPEAAVQLGQAGSYVYVLGDDGKAHLRPIQLRRMAGHQAVVEGGVRVGERVVTDGQIRLRDGALVTVRAEGAPGTATPAPAGMVSSAPAPIGATTPSSAPAAPTAVKP